MLRTIERDYTYSTAISLLKGVNSTETTLRDADYSGTYTLPNGEVVQKLPISTQFHEYLQQTLNTVLLLHNNDNNSYLPLYTVSEIRDFLHSSSNTLMCEQNMDIYTPVSVVKTVFLHTDKFSTELNTMLLVVNNNNTTSTTATASSSIVTVEQLLKYYKLPTAGLLFNHTDSTTVILSFIFIFILSLYKFSLYYIIYFLTLIEFFLLFLIPSLMYTGYGCIFSAQGGNNWCVYML